MDSRLATRDVIGELGKAIEGLGAQRRRFAGDRRLGGMVYAWNSPIEGSNQLFERAHKIGVGYRHLEPKVGSFAAEPEYGPADTVDMEPSQKSFREGWARKAKGSEKQDIGIIPDGSAPGARY